MLLLGLTGSIGMGKSAVSSMLTSKLGVPVLDSDAVVHELYSPGGAAVEPIGALFPGVVTPEGGISRPELSKFVLGPTNETNMAALEAIVHPLVDASRWKFLEDAERAGETLVVLDIPLLYEKGYESTVDAVAVVSAGSEETQRERVLSRPGMSAEKLEDITARQVPDGEKRKRADFIIDTGCSLEDTEAAVGALVEKLKGGGDGVGVPLYVRAAVWERMKSEREESCDV